MLTTQTAKGSHGIFRRSLSKSEGQANEADVEMGEREQRVSTGSPGVFQAKVSGQKGGAGITADGANMTNDEINKYIHVEVMGIYGHDLFTWNPQSDSDIVACSREGCLYKGSKADVPSECPGWIPDYCSDASPRSLLNEVVAKVVPLVGVSAWSDFTFDNGVRETFGEGRTFASLTAEEYASMFPAPAKVLATACVEAHKSQEQI